METVGPVVFDLWQKRKIRIARRLAEELQRRADVLLSTDELDNAYKLAATMRDQAAAIEWLCHQVDPDQKFKTVEQVMREIGG